MSLVVIIFLIFRAENEENKNTELQRKNLVLIKESVPPPGNHREKSPTLGIITENSPRGLVISTGDYHHIQEICHRYRIAYLEVPSDLPKVGIHLRQSR